MEQCSPVRGLAGQSNLISSAYLAARLTGAARRRGRPTARVQGLCDEAFAVTQLRRGATRASPMLGGGVITDAPVLLMRRPRLDSREARALW